MLHVKCHISGVFFWISSTKIIMWRPLSASIRRLWEKALSLEGSAAMFYRCHRCHSSFAAAVGNGVPQMDSCGPSGHQFSGTLKDCSIDPQRWTNLFVHYPVHFGPIGQQICHAWSSILGTQLPPGQMWILVNKQSWAALSLFCELGLLICT